MPVLRIVALEKQDSPNFHYVGMICMILGIGADIIELSRLADVKQTFLNRVYTSNEISNLSDSPARRGEQLAGMFAAKEAVVKALGHGFGRIRPNEIDIFHNDDGCPKVCLSGNAKTAFDTLGANTVHISISHCKDYAVAYAIVEGRLTP